MFVKPCGLFFSNVCEWALLPRLRPTSSGHNGSGNFSWVGWGRGIGEVRWGIGSSPPAGETAIAEGLRVSRAAYC